MAGVPHERTRNKNSFFLQSYIPANLSALDTGADEHGPIAAVGVLSRRTAARGNGDARSRWSAHKRTRTHLEYYNFGLGRRNLGRRAAAAQGMTHQWRKFAPAHTKAALHASARGTHLLGQQRLARIAK
jgi:hypothetical protein